MLIKLALVCAVLITIKVVQSCEKYSLRNKRTVVTGGAQGIGYAIADNFLNEGVEFVIILDKQLEKGHQAAVELNKKYGKDNVIFIHCDVTTDLDEVSEKILNKYKYIDIFVNNAGIMDEEQPGLTIKTNTLALVEWSLKFWEKMRRDKKGNGGTIINMSSIFGYYVLPFLPAYTSSKYGVLGFSKTLGHEYTFRDTDVRVLALCPGFTDTAMTRQRMVSAKQHKDFQKIRKVSVWQTADDVGKGAVHVYKCSESGKAWDIVGGNVTESPAIAYMTAEYIDNLPK